MRFKFYLDDTEVTEPIGSEGLVTTIKRDKTVNGILTTQDATLSFIEDGYDYLLDLLNNDSFCSSAEIRIMISQDEGQNYSEYFKGIIFISDVRFIEEKGYAKTKIQDNSFDAKINNNKNIEALPHVGRSKNDITITAAPSVTVELFDVATGAPIAITGGVGNEAQGRAYRVYDLFRFYVDFMTDGEILFASTLFDIGGIYEGLVITSGYMVKGYNGVTPEDEFNTTFPKLTYSKILKDLKNKLNLTFLIENGSTAPTLRIELSSYANDEGTTLLTIDDIDSIETYISQSDIYSSVSFGSSGLIFDSAYTFPEDIAMLGFKDETFHSLGTCNIDNTLNLSGDFITSSNAIEEAIDLANLSSMSDDSVVLINSTALVSGTSYEATATNWIDSSASRFYNEALNNNSISLNYVGSLPNSIALFLGNANNEFLASSTSNTARSYVNPGIATSISPVAFQDDSTPPNFDANARWNNATYEYSCLASGSFTFNCNLTFQLNPQVSGGADITIYPVIDVYDSLGFAGGNLLRSVAPFDPNGYYNAFSASGTLFNITAGGTIVLNATEKAVLRISYRSTTSVRAYLLRASTFGISASNSGGGVYQTYDPSQYSILRHEFNYPLSFDNFMILKNNPKGVIEFKTDNGRYRKGLIENIRYGVSSSKLTLFSSRNLNK